MTKVPRKNNKSAAKSTVSSSSRGAADPTEDPASQKAKNTESLAAAFPANPNKAGEYGEAARTPKPGATAEPAGPEVTGSTLTETTTSA